MTAVSDAHDNMDAATEMRLKQKLSKRREDQKREEERLSMSVRHDGAEHAEPPLASPAMDAILWDLLAQNNPTSDV